MAYEHCMLVQQKLVILVAFTNIIVSYIRLVLIWVHVSDIQTVLPGHIVLWAFSFNLYVPLSLFEGILSISDLDKNTCQHCNIEGTSPYLQLGSKICLWLLVILCACRGLCGYRYIHSLFNPTLAPKIQGNLPPWQLKDKLIQQSNNRPRVLRKYASLKYAHFETWNMVPFGKCGHIFANCLLVGF